MATKAQIQLLIDTAESGRSLKEFRESIKNIQKAISEATDPADIQRLQTALALARDGAGDFNERLKLIGANRFERLATLGQTIAGGFQVATGALGLFGTENEKLNEIINQTNALFTTFAGLGQLSESTRQLGDLAAAFGLTKTAKAADTIATEVNTGAQIANTTATNTATVATTAFGTALKLLGIGLLISGLAALITYWDDITEAIGKVTGGTDKLKQTFSGIGAAALSLGQTLLTTLATPYKALWKLFKDGPDAAMGEIKAAFDGLKNIFTDAQKAQKEAELATGVEQDIERQIKALQKANSKLQAGSLERLNNEKKILQLQLSQQEEGSEKYLEIQDKLTQKIAEIENKRLADVKDSLNKSKEKRDQAYADEIATAEANMEFKKSQYKTEEELNNQALIDELELINAKIKIAKKFGKDTTALELERQKTIQKINFENVKLEEKNADDTKTANEKDLKDREEKYSKEEKAIDRQLALKKAAYQTEKELADNSTKDEIAAIELKIAARQKEGLEIADLLIKLAELKQKASFEQQKADEEAIANAPDFFNQFFGIKSDDEIAKMTPKEKSAAIAEIIGNTFASLQDTINGFYELRLQELEQQKNDELDLFDKQTERELQGVEKGSEREKNILQRRQLEREKLERDADKKARGIQKEQAQFQNTIALFRAIADGAAATIGAFRLDPSGILASFVAATAAAQVALIIAQGNQIAKIKAEKGGLLLGPSHSQGGIKGSGTFGNIEVEGGEFIMNKTSTSRYLPLLESLNRPGNTNLNMDPISSKLDAVERQLILLNNNPTRAYIIDRDLTETQDKIEFIKRRTEF